ncbi:universal stress protein [Kribbella antibiotica]|uniref:Universal stress protein n=1 Tax=Kribbella antibiotica TaxID=190195 RepID=A0A4R4ZTM4_9ACTN|nr:universal stress protein [Kribbella antibiotica]TDD61484.1 universal stress protein [Kribbella antibiotica]
MSSTTPSSETVRPVIQVGIDGAWREAGALHWALYESHLRDEPLHAIHAVDETVRRSRYYEPIVTTQAESDLADDVRTWMKDQADGLDHEATLVEGSPASALSDAAQGSRMLVVGRRGMGSFKRLLLGSTSEAVASRAQVPVVVVPDGWTARTAGGPVVAGLDDSGENGPAVEFAAELAIERNVSLRLVHVWDVPPVYGWDTTLVAGVAEDWAATADKHYEAVATQWRHKYPDLEIQLDIRRGHAVEGLLDAAAAFQAQIVVMGGHHRSHLSVLLLGSVVRGVLQHATCPVAVVHCDHSDSA